MTQIFRGEEGRRDYNPSSGRLGGAGTSSPSIANVEGEASATTGAHIEPTRTTILRPPRVQAILNELQQRQRRTFPPFAKSDESSIVDDLLAQRAALPSEGGDGNTSSRAMAEKRHYE